MPEKKFWPHRCGCRGYKWGGGGTPFYFLKAGSLVEASAFCH
jgi:hypothetical protein